MNTIITIIIGVVLIGIAILLCLFSCIMASKADDYWDDFKKHLENKHKWKI